MLYIDLYRYLNIILYLTNAIKELFNLIYLLVFLKFKVKLTKFIVSRF